MLRTLVPMVSAALLFAGCTKEKPALHVTFNATCRDCIVSYAVGPAQSKKDTLLGIYDQGTGDSVPGTGAWTAELVDGDKVFLSACRLRMDPSLGVVTLSVSGDVQTLSATGAPTDSCTVINATAHAR